MKRIENICIPAIWYIAVALMLLSINKPTRILEVWLENSIFKDKSNFARTSSFIYSSYYNWQDRDSFHNLSNEGKLKQGNGIFSYEGFQIHIWNAILVLQFYTIKNKRNAVNSTFLSLLINAADRIEPFYLISNTDRKGLWRLHHGCGVQKVFKRLLQYKQEVIFFLMANVY